MRLEFEPNVSAFPLVENELFEEVGHPASPDFETLLKKGISAAQSGERGRARVLLTEASECEPRSEDVWMWLASISEYPEELLVFLNNVLEINPANSRAIEWLAATKSLIAATFVQRAVAAREEGSGELAGQCLDQALAYDPNCEMAWVWKAAYSQSDDHKLEFLGRVLEINPDNHDARGAVEAIYRSRSHAAFNEAKAAAVAGDRQKAVEMLDEFLLHSPGSVEAWILRSHLSPNVDEKVEALEKALEIDPENAAARSGLAFLALTFGSSMEQTEPETHVSVEVSGDNEPVQWHDDNNSTMGFAEGNTAAEMEVAESADDDLDFYSQPTQESIVIEPAPEWPAEEMAVQTENETDASAETVEDLSPFVQEAIGHDYFSDETVEVQQYDPADSMDDVYEVETEQVMAAQQYHEAESVPTVAANSHFDEQPEEQYAGFTCPFCSSVNEPQAFKCTSCHATLTLSDIESLLLNLSVDREVVQQAVTEMEAEWNLRDFNEQELTDLGIGYFNLGSLEPGFKYLQEASRLNPNNVILSGQVNAIAIRIGEIRKQNEAYNLMPKGKTILVVDDSPTVRKLISGKLEKSGHNVVCAVDGVDALARLEEGFPDLVLLDITMPRMDGYEVCKKIRANQDAKDIPVVMISGKDGFFDKVRGRMAGTTGYITKPFGPETLMKALETYLIPDRVEGDGSVSPAE